MTPHWISERISITLPEAIAQARVLSRHSGTVGFLSEVKKLVTNTGSAITVATHDIVEDLRRGRLYAANYAARWITRAEELGASAANAATFGNLKRIAVTESSQAFNAGRVGAAELLELSKLMGPDDRLFKVWDAMLDACPICEEADGTIVAIDEPFPAGEPGSVHPNCRCTWQTVSFEERSKVAAA